MEQRRTRTGLKIQLDTTAIERIFQDADGEIPVDIKNAVVQEFVNRHLKGIVNADMVQAAIAEAHQQIYEKVGWRTQIKPEIISLVKNHVAEIIGQMMHEQMSEIHKYYQSKVATIQSTYEQKADFLEKKCTKEMRDITGRYTDLFQQEINRVEATKKMLAQIAEKLPAEARRDIVASLIG